MALDQISQSQTQHEAVVNQDNLALQPAAALGIHQSLCGGLTFAYYGGRLSDSVTVADGTLTLTNAATNYIECTTAGVVSSNTSGFTSGRIRMYTGVAASSLVTYTDVRVIGLGLGGAFTGGTLASALNEATAVTIASGSTVNIGAAAGNTISVTGTSTITAFDTIAAGAIRRVVFGGILTLTYNATSLILPTAANITTAAGDTAEFLSLGSGNWRCVDYQRASGAALVATGTFTGGTLTSALNDAPIGTIASGSTVNIGAASENTITISGTSTITAFDTIASGARRRLIFSGILILTYNATSLILPTSANITTAAGDSAEFTSLGSGNWRCTDYQLASGAALVGTGSVPSGTGFVHITSAAQDGTARAIDLGSADVTATASISANTHKIINVVDPASAQDAATKAYVDAQVLVAGVDPNTFRGTFLDMLNVPVFL